MINKNITVYVDIDNTLNEFQNHFITYVNKLEYTYDNSKMDSYEIFLGINHPDKYTIMEKIFNDDTFWLSIPSTEHSYHALHYLYTSYDTYVVTSPWNKQNEHLKKVWLSIHFPFVDSNRVLFCHDKWILAGDIIIDDKPEYLEKCKPNMTTIKSVQPYNKHIKADYTLNSWRDIYDIMFDYTTKRHYK